MAKITISRKPATCIRKNGYICTKSHKMKNLLRFSAVVCIAFCFAATAAARPYGKGRPAVKCANARIYAEPVDSCKFGVVMSFLNVVRKRERLCVEFFLQGAGGQVYEPIELLFEGDRRNNREQRLRRRRGEPELEVGLSVKSRRKRYTHVTYKMTIFEPIPWKDSIRTIRVEQTLMRGKKLFRHPSQTLPAEQAAND